MNIEICPTLNHYENHSTLLCKFKINGQVVSTRTFNGEFIHKNNITYYDCNNECKLSDIVEVLNRAITKGKNMICYLQEGNGENSISLRNGVLSFNISSLYTGIEAISFEINLLENDVTGIDKLRDCFIKWANKTRPKMTVNKLMDSLQTLKDKYGNIVIGVCDERNGTRDITNWGLVRYQSRDENGKYIPCDQRLGDGGFMEDIPTKNSFMVWTIHN